MALTVTGLSSDYYFSNNPIYLALKETSEFDYFTIKIGEFAPASVTPINDLARVDISNYIKSSFQRTDNFRQLNVIVSAIKNSYIGNATVPTTISTTTINKRFIRGGKRGDLSNVNATNGQSLVVTERVPYWAGYPIIVTSVQSSGLMDYLPANIESDPFFERMKIKGCNSVYVNFYNSLGGNSYWLFEGITDSQKATHQGIINNRINFDLGSEFDKEIELYSKVPKRYIPLMQDLIISPNINIYTVTDSGVVWQRYYSTGNTIEYNPSKNAQEVKIKLKPFNKFKPKTIWE